MAVELGWSAARVQRTIKAVRGAWITVVEVEAESRHAETIVQLSNHYVLRWPDGRRLSAFDKRLA